jgi:hypothetical protein
MEEIYVKFNWHIIKFTFLVMVGLPSLLTFSACDEDEIDDDEAAIVVTKPREGFNFVNIETYALPDKVAVIKDPEDTSAAFYFTEANEKAILQQIQTNLDARGYTRVQPGEGIQPDFMVEVSVIGKTASGVYYDYWYPTWGGYYDSYYGAYYGGAWLPTAVPYVVSADMGSLVINITDPKNPITESEKLPTIWAGVSVGIVSAGSENERSARLVEDINQMFNQSPYFLKAPAP